MPAAAFNLVAISIIAGVILLATLVDRGAAPRPAARPHLHLQVEVTL